MESLVCRPSSSCLCSARMNAWLLFLPGYLATSVERLRLVQSCWSAHEALLVVLAIDRREAYCFLNSAIDSSVTRKAFGVGLALSHPNSTNRRTDLVLHSSWRAASAIVLVSPFARARSSCAKRWNPSYDTSSLQPFRRGCQRQATLSTTRLAHTCPGRDGTMLVLAACGAPDHDSQRSSHFGNPSTIELVIHSLPHRFFRISRLRNFSTQHIEPQWFTANCFYCSTYGARFPPASRFWGRRRQAGFNR